MTDATIVNTRKSLRLSVLEAIRAEADPLFGAVDGASGEFISRGVLGEALQRVKASPLPSIDEKSAEVTTPADIYVDAICPECELPTRILIQLSAVLETTREAGSSIKLKAKAKARTHVHHQLALDVGDENQEELGLEVEAVDVEDDEDDLRPTGEVNVDELKGDVERSIDDDDDLLPA